MESSPPPAKRLCLFERIRGNEIHSTARDCWTKVTAIKLREKNEKLTFTMRLWKYAFCYKQSTTFQIEFSGGSPLFELRELDSKESNISCMLCEAVENLILEKVTTFIPLTIEGNPEGGEDTESGDEYEPEHQTIISSPFTTAELCLFQLKFDTCHTFYHESIAAGFHNAQGKEFMRAFLQLLLDGTFVSRISTSPSGDKQPGAFHVDWILTTTSERSQSIQGQDRVADVVSVHLQTRFFMIVVEIKSSNVDAASQNIEQMVGLFHPDQRIMLGLSVGTLMTTPRLLQRDGQSLILTEINKIAHTTKDGLRNLAALVLAISKNSLDFHC